MVYRVSKIYQGTVKGTQKKDKQSEMNMELYGSSNAKDTSRDLYDEQGEIRSRNFLPTHGKDIQEINRKRNQEHNKIHI